MGGQPDRLAVHLVEGPRHFPDLVGRGDLDRIDLDVLARVLALAESAHHLGQPVAGHVERAHAQRAQRRSEEHTSELQSLRHLVCRLLLEKKKKKKKNKKKLKNKKKKKNKKEKKKKKK